MPNKSDSIFGKFWGVFLSFSTFSKNFVKQFTKDTNFSENENPPKKLSKSHCWRLISRNYFFAIQQRKTQRIVSVYSQNCFWFFDDLLLISPWLCDFCFFSSEKIKNNESTFNYAIHQCCFSCVDGMYSNKIALPTGRLKRFSITTTLVSGTTKTF